MNTQQASVNSQQGMPISQENTKTQQGPMNSQQGMPISQQEYENATRANEFATSQRDFSSFLTAKFVVLFLTLILTIMVGLIGGNILRKYSAMD
jgi:hypothetical protein